MDSQRSANISDDDSFPSLPPEDESLGRKRLMDYIYKHTNKRKHTFPTELFPCTSQPVNIL